ncbi:MAG TPA: cupin domain-containing protein [Stellaceae bacterium]|nr:cupin domain-containing protein [Stellaceae bacterium]
MAEIERTRTREREPTTLNSYELGIQRDRAFAERQATGRIVVRLQDTTQQLMRQGHLRFYLDAGRSITDTPLQNWSVFTHEVRTVSGKHRHQGGLVIYVIDGQGYSVVDGERIDWEKGDLLLLPLKPEGVEHQHFNVNPDKPALWMAFIHQGTREYLASELTQTEPSAEWKAQEARAGR